MIQVGDRVALSRRALRRCCLRARGVEQRWNLEWWANHLRDRLGDVGTVMSVMPVARYGQHFGREEMIREGDSEAVQVYWDNRQLTPDCLYGNAWDQTYGASWLRVL